MQTNEYEKDKYNHLILEKEQYIDGLKAECQQSKKWFQALHEDLHNGFSSLSKVNEEERYYENSDRFVKQQQLAEQEYLFQQQLRVLEEQVLKAYQTEVTRGNTDIDDLYKKRNELTWD